MNLPNSKKTSMQFIFLIATTILTIVIISCSQVTYEEIISKHRNNAPRITLIKDDDGNYLEKKVYYSTGQLKSTVSLDSNGKSTGKYLEWNLYGADKATGKYKDGKRTGTWIFWYQRNSKKEEGAFNNDKRHGLWTEYHPNENIKSKKLYDNGDSIGTWISFYDDGTLKKSNSCFSKNDDGEFKEFTQRGKLRLKIQCQNGSKHGLFETYDLTERLKVQGYYNHDYKDSIWKYFYANGNLKSLSTWNNNLRIGKQIALDFDGDTLVNTSLIDGTGSLQTPCLGTLKGICADSNFKHGQLHGKVKFYRPETKVWSEEEWFEGELISEKAWRNDKLIRNGRYKQSKKNGLWEIYYLDGTIKERHNYRQDTLWGNQEYFDSSGTLLMRRIYQGPKKKVIVEVPSMKH